MNLDSFTVAYSLSEDRLLLQAIGDGDTQSFWITRRAALMIADAAQKVLTEQYQKFGAHKVSPEHVGSLLAFDHSIATQKNPPKAGSVQSNLKKAPILLYQIDYSADNAEHCLINLKDAAGRGHGYRLTADMLHALLNLVQTQCNQAAWGIRLISPAINSAKSLH